MYRRLLIVGIAVALVGMALWYVPLQPLTDGPQVDNGTSNTLGVSAPIDLLGATISFSLTWSSHSSVTLSLYRCGPHPACTGLHASDYVAGESGTSGVLHWKGAANQYFALISTSGPLTVTLQYSEPVLGGAVGLGVLGFGGFLVFLGLWLAAPVPPAPPTKRASKDEEIYGPDPR